MSKTLTPRASSLVLATALALAAATAGTGAALAQACLDNRQIQAKVDSGEVRSHYDVLAEAGHGADTVLNFQLCDDNGRLVYIIGVMSPSGEARNLTLSAR